MDWRLDHTKRTLGSHSKMFYYFLSFGSGTETLKKEFTASFVSFITTQVIFEKSLTHKNRVAPDLGLSFLSLSLSDVISYHKGLSLSD